MSGSSSPGFRRNRLERDFAQAKTSCASEELCVSISSFGARGIQVWVA